MLKIKIFQIWLIFSFSMTQGKEFKYFNSVSSSININSFQQVLNKYLPCKRMTELTDAYSYSTLTIPQILHILLPFQAAPMRNVFLSSFSPTLQSQHYGPSSEKPSSTPLTYFVPIFFTSYFVIDTQTSVHSDVKEQLVGQAVSFSSLSRALPEVLT